MGSKPQSSNRRTFLKSALTLPAGTLFAARAAADIENTSVLQLSDEHTRAVDRRRRIVVHYDAYNALGGDFEEWIKYRFAYVDEPGSQIDALWWDIGPMGPAAYPGRTDNALLEPWRKLGIDWIGRLVKETRTRGLEVCWNHRVSEVDINPNGSGAAWKGPPHPFKKNHRDWVLETWWPHGLWNYAVPEVRQFKVDLLRQLAETYDLDGFQLDFARHVPCLQPGRQWELRDHLTRFVRMVRTMLLDVAQRRGRPILLAARVPRTLKGCRIDGFDIAQWTRQNLVDILTLGTRSIDVDIAGYRQLTVGTGIKLQPCLDDHHATDGYRYPSIEFLRGVFANWWQQGADSVVTFNWSNAPPDMCTRAGVLPGPQSQRQAYHQVGSQKTLAKKDKIFAVERRGGYPWAEGFFNRNDTAPLPVPLKPNGTSTALVIPVADDLRQIDAHMLQITLRIILFGSTANDQVKVEFGGTTLRMRTRDVAWKDPQIFSPRPQPASGSTGNYKTNPSQKLQCLDFTVDPHSCRVGKNQVDIRLTQGAASHNIVLEKLELHVNYA